MIFQGRGIATNPNFDMISMPSDVEIVRLSTWSAQDLSSLYVRFRPQLERHARKFLSSQTQVDDVVQDAFLYLLVTLPELDSELGVLRFLKWKTRLLALDLIRGNSRVTLVPIEDHENIVSDSDDMSKNLERLEDAAIVRLALSKLNEKHRNALIMNVFQEKSIDEMSEFFMLKPNATRQLLLRAQRAFKIALVGHTDTSSMSNAQVLSVAFRKAAEAAANSGTKVGIFIFAVMISALGLNAVSGPNGLISSGSTQANPTLPSQQEATERVPQSEQTPFNSLVDTTEEVSTGGIELVTIARKKPQPVSERLQSPVQESIEKYVAELSSIDEISFTAAAVEERAKVVQFSTQDKLEGSFEFLSSDTVKISNFKAILFTSEKAVELEVGLSKTTQSQNEDGSITATYVGTITRLDDGALDMSLREVKVTAELDAASNQIKSLNVQIN